MTHWPFHKLDCNSDIRKPTWKPAWEAEERMPDFVGVPMNAYFAKSGGEKFIWGNVPALDLLRLKDNEGSSTDLDLSLLLAGRSETISSSIRANI